MLIFDTVYKLIAEISEKNSKICSLLDEFKEDFENYLRTLDREYQFELFNKKEGDVTRIAVRVAENNTGFFTDYTLLDSAEDDCVIVDDGMLNSSDEEKIYDFLHKYVKKKKKANYE